MSISRLQKRIDFLRGVQIFKGFPTVLLRHIARRLKEDKCAAGETIFREDDLGDAMYLITDGVAEIQKGGVPVLTRTKGEVIGEFALLDDAPRSGSVIAKTDLVVWKLARQDFQKLFLEKGADPRGMFKMLTQKLRESVAVQQSSHKQVIKLEEQRNALMDAVNRLVIGVILLDRTGEILLINRTAHSILNQRDGLSIGQSGLAASDALENKALRKLIHEAVLGAGGVGNYTGGAIVISRPSFKRPLALLVTPLIAHEFAVGDRGVAAALFVADPESGITTADGVLRRLYGLTRAETRVTSFLLQGQNLEKTAGELNITVDTARSHLKSIFAKTNTNRQSDLVRLLLTSPAIIRPE